MSAAAAAECLQQGDEPTGLFLRAFNLERERAMTSPLISSAKALAAIASVSLMAAACSSSSSGGNGGTPPSSSTSPSASSSDANAIPAAVAALSALETRPESLPSTVPITKSIPPGKTIDWLQCGISDCAILTPPLKAAAAALGWKVKIVDAGLTPETVKNAWDLAVRDKPDAVFASGFPSSIFTSELKQLNTMHIPVIDFAVHDKPGNGITAVIQGDNTSYAIGVGLADWVLAKKGKSANTLLVTSSTFANLPITVAGFKHEYSTLCPGCAVATLDAPATTFGTTLPGNVVTYLRAHPAVNYIAADEGAMSQGLPQAIKTAGLNIQMITQYPNQTTAQYLQDGSVMAGIIMPQEVDAMWQMTDALARYYAGQSVTPADAPSPLWFVTPSTVSQISFPYSLVPNYPAKYKKLWNVS